MKNSRVLTWVFLLPVLLYTAPAFAELQPIKLATSAFESKDAASLEKINDRVSSGFENFFTAAKWFGLALGVITVMISLKNIADITADKKNGSIGMNILGLMVGGAMTAVSAILFAAGGATERIVTGKEL